MNCSAIEPGGSNYEPNTLLDHATWAVANFYLLHDYTLESCKGKIVDLTPESCYPTAKRKRYD
jgi:hypothetical protein